MTDELKCQTEGCPFVAKTPKGLKVHVSYHNVRWGRKVSNGNVEAKPRKKWSRRPPVQVVINFCSNCGSRIPNAFVMEK